MNPIFRLSIVSVIIGSMIVGCQSNSTHSSDSLKDKSLDIETVENVEETPKVLSEEEAKEIVNGTLDSLFSKLDMIGMEHSWGQTKSPDYILIENQVENMVTDEFSSIILSDFVKEYYCKCGSFRPLVNTEVRFAFEQNDEQLKITAFEPAAGILSGYKWEFEFVKDKDIWKLHHWESTQLEGLDIEFTVEEAKAFLSNDKGNPKYVDEYEDGDGNSIYIFNMVNAPELSQVGFHSKDTSLLVGTRLKNVNHEIVQNNEGIAFTDLYFESPLFIRSNTDRYYLIERYGYPISENETTEGMQFEYVDSTYYLNKEGTELSKVVINESKAESFYYDFNEVIDVYVNDPEVWEYSSEYTYEKKSDNEGHHLILKDVYQKSRIIFTSEHQSGNPIKKITFTFD
ncbi:hypothetical protein [Alkalihalobacterium bogoriense]|uniref:hypothetical protein n=1 Tax=Alkalihalobacterium bogoriense TaxID=246272 RepID=UPI00047D7BD2|nr:hypothetical protein [Alkalihalobacterium bogoriense]